MTTTLAKRPVTRPQALTLITCITVGCGGVTVPQHELAVHGGGGGNGTLFSDPVGINCSITAGAVSNDCTAMYDDGTPVTLAAAPEARSTFVGWSGGCDSTEPCHVTMSEATNVTATFELIRLELTVDGTGTGDGGVTSNPSGLDCTIVAGVASNDCTAPFVVDGTVTLTATAGAGSTFDGWSGACTGVGLCQVTMSMVDTVTAMFNSFCKLTTPGDADGDRLPDCAETNTGVFVGALDSGTDPNNWDTDGDGISDGDEVLETLWGLDLPLMGVNPLRQDILIEYDWFRDAIDCGSHSHRPTAEALAMVTAAFANAPTQNPDGSTGINIIHDYGQGGSGFAGGKFVADVDGVLAGGVNNIEFQDYKAANFDSTRHGYFRYTLLPHRYNTNSNSSGQAELPGDDMIVSLYCAGGDQNVANTIMHELGHNLNLRHGGTTNLNWKPNYNSVMNYRYQFAGVDRDCTPPGDGILNYSTGIRITLDENNLSEPQGICAGPPWDWNDDGDVTDVGLMWDINVDGVIGDNRFDILTDHNDWAALFFGGLYDGDGAPVLAREIMSCTQPAPLEKR